MSRVERIAFDPAVVNAAELMRARALLDVGAELAEEEGDCGPLLGASRFYLQLNAALDPGSPAVDKGIDLVSQAVCLMLVKEGGCDGLAWLDGLHASLVLRDQDRVRLLVTADPAQMREREPRLNDFVYHHVGAVRALFRGQPDAAERAWRTHFRVKQSVGRGDLPAKLLWSPLNMLLIQLLSGDAAGFNRLLELALEAHDTFYRAQPPADQVAGALALGPLAYACAAASRGIRLRVESDYIPARLVETDG